MAEREPLRIGLTGGIASGKSTVAALFADKRIPVIDTDVIARELVRPGQPALREIEREFGADIVGRDGELRRRRLRQLIFGDDARRQALEAILHPRIRAETVARAKAAGGAYQIVVVPLLAESDLKDWVERILVVDCSEELQLARLLQRDSEDEGQARRMLAAQASREERLAIADDVIVNDGTLDDTARQVDELHRDYLELVRQLARELAHCRK